MVGKAKRARIRLHPAAVKLTGSAKAESEPPQDSSLSWPPLPLSAAVRSQLKKDADHLSTSIFAGTKIDPKLLVRKLDDEDCKTVASSKKGDKIQLPKKEKIKQRHEQWLQKIEMIKLAKQKKKAQEKRKSTPVVGDMQPLSDALPELTDLISTSNNSVAQKSKSNAKKKPERIQYSRMKQAQKRKLIEEEVARFKVTIENPAFKADPLAAVSEHLRKRIRQEDEI
ncbi:protein FAM207A [Mobula hypostoma]|uniref:protein FAM207A n=1 Tax=Mobula hypostoma TaxID=723540 RepID=UPI002FC2D250